MQRVEVDLKDRRQWRKGERKGTAVKPEKKGEEEEEEKHVQDRLREI